MYAHSKKWKLGCSWASEIGDICKRAKEMDEGYSSTTQTPGGSRGASEEVLETGLSMSGIKLYAGWRLGPHDG
ncbi:hypothetical protein U1Q18_029257 [Sarracenia purpurea var. burkii]